jgi:hypothetical protein
MTTAAALTATEPNIRRVATEEYRRADGDVVRAVDAMTRKPIACRPPTPTAVETV